MLDIWADLHFFASMETKDTALVASAVVRNLLTLVAVVCLFLNRKWAAYALLLISGLGLWRRLGYLAPILQQGPEDALVSATGGLDVGFRFLILGLALGLLLGKNTEGES